MELNEIEMATKLEKLNRPKIEKTNPYRTQCVPLGLVLYIIRLTLSEV